MLKQLELHFKNVTVAGVEGISLEQLNQKGRIISINEQMKESISLFYTPRLGTMGDTPTS